MKEIATKQGFHSWDSMIDKYRKSGLTALIKDVEAELDNGNSGCYWTKAEYTRR